LLKELRGAETALATIVGEIQRRRFDGAFIFSRFCIGK
jgi:tRNA U34 5-carboxymethylaminomethyl modifying GTPase MnmE/TrmE